jgi:predicted enzyme related to lactoylglutathione lyase
MKLDPRESVILAEDFRAVVDWYQRVLGFKVTRLVESDYHYCNLENESGIRLGIAAAKEMGVNPIDRKSNTVVLQFQVADVQGFLENVREKGGDITFGPSLDKKEGFWFGGFSDLEGNPFWVVDENCP